MGTSVAVANVTDISQGMTRAPAGFRQKPHNLEIEAFVIGSVIANNRSLERVRANLRTQHFYGPGHAALYEKIVARVVNGEVCDVAVLCTGMDSNVREDMYRLAQACAGVSLEELDQWVHELIRLWQRRRQIEVAESLVNASYDLDVPFDDWRRQAVEELAQVEAEGPVKSPPQPFEYISHENITEDLPPREFLVHKWVPIGCVTSLYGAGGSGKSFLSMMLAMCVAAGRDWLGFACAQATVLAIMCEDDDAEICRRRNRIAKCLKIARQDLGERLFVTGRVGDHNALMEFPHGAANRTEFFYRITSEANRLRARLVILDNAAQLFHGNENDRAQVTAFLNSCAGIAREIQGAVLLLGHPPKIANVEFSGSTAWDAVVRSRIWFKRVVEENGTEQPPDLFPRYTLELVKSNYAKPFGIELQENAQGVVEYVGELQKPAQTARISNQYRTLDAFRYLFSTHRRAIAIDDIVAEAIKRGIVAEADPETAAWRDRRRTVRKHLAGFEKQVEERGDDTFALKP